jgi:hypothetical protein
MGVYHLWIDTTHQDCYHTSTNFAKNFNKVECKKSKGNYHQLNLLDNIWESPKCIPYKGTMYSDTQCFNVAGKYPQTHFVENNKIVMIEIDQSDVTS